MIYNNLGSIIECDKDIIYSSSDLQNMVAVLANKFHSSAIGVGDRVVLMRPASGLFFAELLSLWSIGAVVLVLNPDITDFELVNICEFSGVTKYVGQNREVINLTHIDSDISGSETRISLNNVKTKLDDDALILFTSGSTGKPKGVVHTHRSILSRITSNITSIGSDVLSTTLLTLPVFFGHGLIGNSLTPLLNGSKLVIGGTGLKNFAKHPSYIEKYKVTFMSSVPSYWKFMLTLNNNHDLSSLKQINVGSAPLSTDLWGQIINWSGKANVVNMYGITETCNWVGGAGSKDNNITDGLVGKGIGATFGVIDSNGNISNKGEGEIVIQSPSLLNRYLNNENETSSVMKGLWYKTGDLGFFDTNNNLIISGRVKFEINKGGLKIAAEEIDLLLERHELIISACAFSIADEFSGELIGVAVVVKNGFEVQKIREWCSDYITPYKIPDKWYVIESMPLNERGKVDRLKVNELCKNL